MRSFRRKLAVGVLLVAALGSSAAAATGRPTDDGSGGPTATLTPVDGKPHTYELRFESKILGQETTSLVVLPSSYHENGRRSPVAYYLHGASVGVSARSWFDRLSLAAADF